MSSVAAAENTKIPASETVTEPVQNNASNEVLQKPAEIDLTTIPISSENVSLNVMVGFLNVAQKRGCFNIKESAKIWECIKLFQKNAAAAAAEAPAQSDD